MSEGTTTNTKKKSFASDFRKFFGRGLAILLPSILTLWILWTLFRFVYQNVGEPINAGIRLVIIEVVPKVAGAGEAAPDGTRRIRVPDWYVVRESQIVNYLRHQRQRGANIPLEGEPGYAMAFDRGRSELRREQFGDWWNSHWYLEAAGLIVAIGLIYLVGLLLGNLLGRKIYNTLERWLAKIPGFKQVYPHVKQVVDLIMGERAMAFNKAVLVQYPRKGIWTVGLLTGDSLKTVAQEAGGPVVSVFIPSTPTPFTGFTINVPKDEAIDLPITIDQAIRFIITAGVLNQMGDTPGKGLPGKGLPGVETPQKKPLSQILPDAMPGTKPGTMPEQNPGPDATPGDAERRKDD